MSTKRKVGLIALFGAGALVIGVGGARIPTIPALGTYTDPTFDDAPCFVWSCLELAVGVWVATAPAVKNAVSRIKKNLGTVASRYAKSPSHGNGGTQTTGTNEHLQKPLAELDAPMFPTKSFARSSTLEASAEDQEDEERAMTLTNTYTTANMKYYGAQVVVAEEDLHDQDANNRRSGMTTPRTQAGGRNQSVSTMQTGCSTDAVIEEARTAQFWSTKGISNIMSAPKRASSLYWRQQGHEQDQPNVPLGSLRPSTSSGDDM